MNIVVDDDVKIRVAKWGPNKIFDDMEKRKDMSDYELIKLFDDQWDIFKRAIEFAPQCDASEAEKRLTPNERNYFIDSQEHRQFRLETVNLEFVSQLEQQGENHYQLTQLWRVSSSDTDPRTLYVKFETKEERQRFTKLARRLSKVDTTLALELVTEFMNKFPDDLLD